MSATAAPPVRPGPGRRRRWRVVLLAIAGVLLVKLVCFVGYFWVKDLRAGAELEEARAETDRLDPGWRLADLEARRRPVPAAENSATVVLAAGALLPPRWEPGVVLEDAEKILTGNFNLIDFVERNPKI